MLIRPIPLENESVTSGSSRSSRDDVESIIQDHIDLFWFLKDRQLKAEFDDFNSSKQSLTSLLALALMVSAFSFPFLILLLASWIFRESTVDTINWIVFIMALPVINCLCWWKYLSLRRVLRNTALDRSSLAQIKSSIKMFHSRVFFIIHCLSCYRLISRVIIGECIHTGNVAGEWNCNPLANMGSVPLEGTIFVMLLPFLFSVSIRGGQSSFSIFLWLMSVSTLSFALFYVRARDSFLVIIYYCFFSIILLTEIRHIYYYLFFSERSHRANIQRRERACEEANASELRHMIANCN